MPIIETIIEQQDHTASRATARGHELVMDRPEAKGGQNKGPMGGEALLMALGGCFMSNLLAAAAARDIGLKNARAVIRGELADNGPPRYITVDMVVTADCNPADQLEKLVLISERGCIVANTLGKAVELRVSCG